LILHALEAKGLGAGGGSGSLWCGEAGGSGRDAGEGSLCTSRRQCKEEAAAGEEEEEGLVVVEEEEDEVRGEMEEARRMIDSFLASGVLATATRVVAGGEGGLEGEDGGEGEMGLGGGKCDKEKAREMDRVRERELGMSTSAVIRRAAESIIKS